MWFEIGMKIIDGQPYYPVFDVLLVVFMFLIGAVAALSVLYKNEKLENDYLRRQVKRLKFYLNSRE